MDNNYRAQGLSLRLGQRQVINQVSLTLRGGEMTARSGVRCNITARRRDSACGDQRSSALPSILRSPLSADSARCYGGNRLRSFALQALSVAFRRRAAAGTAGPDM
jgi:ABC-type hemin transport system ATPase subunit